MHLRESGPVVTMARNELHRTSGPTRASRSRTAKDEAMTEYLRAWLLLKTDTRAVTALEYALIGSLIAVAIIGALTTMGTSVKNTFNTISNSL